MDNMTPKEVILKLPPKFQSGNVLIDDGDFLVYLISQIACIAFFFVVYEIYRFIFIKYKVKGYIEKDSENKKVWYILNWVTITHHWIILPMIFYVFRNTCSNENGWPWPSKVGGSYSKAGSDKKWGFIKDDLCFLEMNKGYILLQIFSMGYMLNEFIRFYWWLDEWNSYIYESTYHHVAILIAFVCSMIGGYAYPGLCCMFLIAEVSSIFLNYVDMFDEDTTYGCLALANKLTFFFSYTITRIISWPFLQYLLFWNLSFTWSIVNWVRNICAIIGLILGVGVFFLNIYWYYKILKKLIRIIKGTDGRPAIDDEYKNADNQQDTNGEGIDQEAKKKKSFNLERD